MHLRALLVVVCIGVTVGVREVAAKDEVIPKRPNILWIVSEDNGPQLGCYGDAYADTPNLDGLAERSLRYKRCWSNAPVCAPARTTLITGVHAISTGGHHMRSGVKRSDAVASYPELMRAAGYYCTNHTKTDYNFTTQEVGWHESGKKAHYRNRPNDETPFLAIFNIGVSHESQIRTRPHEAVHDPSKAPLPSYHPDLPEVRRDWAQYYDKLSQMDKEVGKILRGLEEDGLADSTIIFYYGDHGSGMPRSKRWPFNSGLHVPLIVHVPKAYQSLAPEDYQAGGESERLVSFVDFAPTLLSIADRPAGESMQGVAFLGKRSGPAKDYLVGFRGRMDERVDNVRSITDGRYVYMKHFYPDRPYLKHVEYMFQTPTTAVWKSKFDAGELTDAQAKFWQNKPHEELFDLQADPDETINLATQEKYADKVEELRGALMSRLEAIKDVGIYPEPMMLDLCGDEAPYDVVREKGTSFKRLVDIAFTMTGTTTTKPGLNPERIQRLAESGQALARYYAARGASLSGDIATLEKVIGDKNPTVAVAASEGLRRHGDKAQRDAAATRILEIIQSGSFHDLVVVDALNVADRDKELFDTLAKSSKELKSSQKKGSRTGKYIARLQDYIQRSP